MIKIRVEERHIKEGKPRKGNQCAVALAIKDRVKPDADIRVWGRWCFVGDRNIRLSKKVLLFVVNFDDGKPVKPFAFMADIPGHLLRTEQ